VHAQFAVYDAHRVLAHQAGAAGVVAGAAVTPRVIEQLVVGLDLGAGQGLFADEALWRRRGEQPARQAQAADDRAPVGLLRLVARVDRRRVARLVRLGLDIAARQRPHLPGAAVSETGSLLELAGLAVLGLPGAKVHCTSGPNPTAPLSIPRRASFRFSKISKISKTGACIPYRFKCFALGRAAFRICDYR